jgi:membrane protein DedA with SNARE-associated domain/membrane-associated phospholipid phosphatase
MDYIKPYLDYFAANPEWAIVIVFLIAFGEALLIIGLFVPSTAVLVGAGMLVGTGNLEFWPVFLATAVGCIAGDQVSYWAGRMFGTRLKTFWPLNRYPDLVVRGEDFVRLHGGKSIAVGRFIPGVKAVVPGIVGMLGMSQPFFIFVNFTSGIVWAAAHVIPGVLLGQGLALAGELSGRLAIVLLVLFVILALTGWIIRIAAATFSPYLNRLLRRLSDWAKTRNSPSFRRFGRALAPENPRATAILAFLATAVAALIGLADLSLGLSLRDAVSNLDQSIAALMTELRNAPADSIMTGLSLLGDRWVVWSVGLAIAIWLLFWRAWRTAAMVVTLMVLGEVATAGLAWLIERPPTVPGISVHTDAFPSRHTLMSGLVFGLLAVLASHTMGRWSKALVASLCGLLVIAIAFSRVYLNADWLSDVVGGVLLAALLSGLFGMAIEAMPSRRVRPLGLIGFASLAGIIAGYAQIELHHEEMIAAFSPVSRTQIVDETTWAADPWRNLPRQRIDLAGQPEERFVAQWKGGLEQLETALKAKGWIAEHVWTWKDSMAYLDTEAKLQALPPRPLLHQGLKARLTMEKTSTDGSGRDVVRVYKSATEVQGPTSTEPIFLISLTSEVPRKRLLLLSVPSTQFANQAEVTGFVEGLENAPGARMVAGRSTDLTAPAAVFRASP